VSRQFKISYSVQDRHLVMCWPELNINFAVGQRWSIH